MIDAPHIHPGPDGSIDIHWKNDNYELLLNVPVEEGSLAGFYGDNISGNMIKGKMNISDGKMNNGLILWLISN